MCKAADVELIGYEKCCFRLYFRYCTGRCGSLPYSGRCRGEGSRKYGSRGIQLCGDPKTASGSGKIVTRYSLTNLLPQEE